MVVQHNLTAMNSNRMLGITTGTQAKSSEKLSSGYKINRAADDAAGLAISEKMRKQIRGLTQASANAEDGISAVGTESESDRQNIQDEVDQLATEIDRVAETTKFNETYLLKGDRNAIKGFSLDYAAAKKDDHIVGEGEAKANFATTADANGFKIDAVETVGTDAKSEEVNDLLKALRDQGVTVTYNSHWNPAGNAGAGEAESSVKLELNGAAADKYKVVVTDADNNEFAIQNNEGIDILKGIKVSSAPTTAATASNMDSRSCVCNSQVRCT